MVERPLAIVLRGKIYQHDIRLSHKNNIVVNLRRSVAQGQMEFPKFMFFVTSVQTRVQLCFLILIGL